jgi:hypothetical protein
MSGLIAVFSAALSLSALAAGVRAVRDVGRLALVCTGVDGAVELVLSELAFDIRARRL